MYSRRRFTGSILAILFGPGRVCNRAMSATRKGSLETDQGVTAAGPTGRTKIQRYRADAVILLFGIPLYKRAGVGGGQVSVEEAGEGEPAPRALFFAAGSDPERAHGLKRLGWIREVALGSGPALPGMSYFGVLSSSPEESLAVARKSAAAPQSGRILYSAVDGRHTAGHSRSAVTHFEFPSNASWSDRSLIDEAHSRFQADVEWRETSWPNAMDRAPSTFLFQLAALLKQRAKRASGRYVYSEQEYLMELEAQGGGSSDGLRAVRGSIRNQSTGRQTAFRLWTENSPGSIVPVRIEYQPRSFLRLTFEALPG